VPFLTVLKGRKNIFRGKPGLKYPCNANVNVHSEKSIHLKIIEWTSMVHGYSIDLWISICVFSINVLFGMDIAWTFQAGKLPDTG